jgi:hypothetical protein
MLACTMIKTATIPLGLADPAAILDRHATRRTVGVPTVTLLVGPVGTASRVWRHWAAGPGRSVVVANQNEFPLAAWVARVAEQVDLPGAALDSLARRAERDPGELLAEWPNKTRADRDRFWNTLVPNADDDLLRALADLAGERSSPRTVAAAVCGLGERTVRVIAGIVRPASWPAVLFVAGAPGDLVSVGDTAVTWALRQPALAIAIAVPEHVWDDYSASPRESRAKAILREGEVAIRALDAATVEQTLTDAGIRPGAMTAIAAAGADEALLESAVAAVRAADARPRTDEQDDRARSAAERFLFDFLDSLPETAGRFELNAALDFEFGSRPAEVDLLCRSPAIAIELDGYFHFLGPDGYRRDRTKDWELQRRGFVVLRFLAEDVIPQIETIRDRILDAFSANPRG